MLPPIADFTNRLLVHRGALVEQDQDDIVALMPSPLASALEVAEYQRFTFDPRAAGPDAVPVDYGSVLIDRFERIVGELGRTAVVPAMRLPLKSIDPEDAVTNAITVTNGIVRDCRAESGQARYVGFFVEHELLADERVSGLTEVWVNTTTHSAPRLTGLIRALLAADHDGVLDAGDQPLSSGALSATLSEAWSRAAAGATRAVENRLQNTIESLRRRRDRDFTRLREYYEAIDGEIRRRAHRMLLKGDVAAAKAEATRLEATTRAYQARVTDLVARYHTRVRLRPLGALVCALPVHRVTARFHRRSASRTIAMVWNPIDRAIEPPCCDACGIDTASVTLCDDRVHVLCSACHGNCRTCGRPYCRACHARCPRQHEPGTASGKTQYVSNSN